METFGVHLFREYSDRPEKPRRSGVTEIRGPYFSVMGPRCIQDILESMGHFVDGLKFTGGTSSLMPRGFLKEVTGIAHEHGVYVSTGGWAEHILSKGPGSFKEYVQDCKDLGFDTIELSTGFLKFSEEDLLRLIRLVKNAGLKAKPQFDFELADSSGAVAGRSLKAAEALDIETVIRRAERCLEAGADMIMFNAEGLTKNVGSWRTDLVARLIGRLGLERLMFEADEPEILEWFVKKYGSGVNLFVDHSHVMKLECLRSGQYGTRSDWGRGSTYRF